MATGEFRYVSVTRFQPYLPYLSVRLTDAKIVYKVVYCSYCLTLCGSATLPNKITY
jgi:hypothetical protein